MFRQPTVYQIASGVSVLARPCAISVVRISGPHALQCFQLLASKQVSQLLPRKATLTSLRNPLDRKSVIDPSALALYFPGPNSFTGEDVVELHCHGNPVILRELFQALDECNNFFDDKVIREAESGEFTKRAFMNGRLDLTQVEGLADLLHAKTAFQKKQAIHQFEGNLGKFYGRCRQKLIGILAHFEAVIDFADEEDDITEALVLSSVDPQVKELIEILASHLRDNRRGEIMREGVQLAFVGPPNAGKSSLLNALTQRDVAIVSETAGTTRDIVETTLDIEGYPVVLADTAGIRQTSDSIEGQGIKRAISRAEKADLRVIVVDASRELSQIIHDLTTNELSSLWKSGTALVVLNKWDQVTSYTTPDHLISAISQELPDISNLCTASCLEDHTDLSMFLKVLLSQLQTLHAIALTDEGESEHPIITRERHRQLLVETLYCLRRYQGELFLICV
jgi:tRNA modification GTPase